MIHLKFCKYSINYKCRSLACNGLKSYTSLLQTFTHIYRTKASSSPAARILLLFVCASDVTANISIRDRTRPTEVMKTTPSDMKSTLAVLLLCSPTSALQVGTKPTVSIALRVGTPPTASIIHAGKGMNQVALVELGSGCCHGTNSTKAAIRACNNAIEWNSVKVRTIIPGGYDAMMLHVHIAVPAPDTVDLDAVAACFPYGNLQPILVESGGMLGSSRANLPPDEPPDGLMTVACACVTIGFNDESDSTAAAVESVYLHASAGCSDRQDFGD